MGSQTSCRIGDYELLKTLGVGATGKVKLARHVSTGELVAVKIIRKSLLTTRPNLYQKVHREIAVMKLLAGNCLQIQRRLRNKKPFNNLTSHNNFSILEGIGLMNLIQVYDTDHSFVLVLEYCQGGELFDVLVDNGYLPEDTVRDYLQQIVFALEFCHNRGVCHRDLKPENLLLTSDGRIKLADFGMSNLLTPGSLLETSCGSPQYCAPEVIRGDPYEGKSADIWSLGVVLFAMTTGGLPFDDDNLHRLIGKIQSGAYYTPAEVSKPLSDLIQSMMVVDPEHRATIEDIKKSPFFTAAPCRRDIYKESDFDLDRRLPFEDLPIEEPDVTILRYLGDLGLGDFPTIRRRLNSSDHNLEKDFYYQLAEYCRGTLTFQQADDIPPSPPSRSASNSPKPTNSNVAQQTNKNEDHTALANIAIADNYQHQSGNKGGFEGKSANTQRSVSFHQNWFQLYGTPDFPATIAVSKIQFPNNDMRTVTALRSVSSR